MRPENTHITLTFMYFCPLSCHNLYKNGEGKTNGLKQALPSVNSYLFCYSSVLAHFLYTARVDLEFPYKHIIFRVPQTCCTHVWSVGLQLGPWWYMYLCVWMHTMASMCLALFKTRILVTKYPKGALTEVNGFPLNHFCTHRLNRWNKILKLARWKFMPVLALLSRKCDAGACRVLRELGWSCPQVPQCSCGSVHYLIASLDLCQC